MKFFEPHESISYFINSSRRYFMTAYEIIAREAEEWFSLSKLSDADTILEFGGGEGHITMNLARLSPSKFIFIDKNPHMIELARLNFIEAGISERIKIVQNEVENADVESNSVAFVIARGVIQFTDYKKVFANVVKWLKPGGIALIGWGLGKNIPDEYRQRLKERKSRKANERGDKGADKFGMIQVEGYKYLLENFFEKELDYVKINNMNGFFFEIKKISF